MTTLEIACFSPQSALTAAQAGADRIEFCHDYASGGLTPTLDAVATVKSQVTIPVYAMIRPHSRDFHYDAIEYAMMRSSLEALKQAGVDGFVFGILLQGELPAVDVQRNKSLVRQVEGRPCTFHRAFDLIPESGWEDALKDIAECGFSSILASGGPGKSAVDCILSLERLVRRARRYGLEIIVGGGVRSSNVGLLREKTNASVFHSAALVSAEDEVRSDQVREIREALDACSSSY
ncbi:hypothetical protein EYZ11_010468 [Aspergillus tanneri]|uniref:Copper homeostasis protein cutC homolog n=1 Tax=Aspergillus tanneri TaxID=1220188 RepID=A0A4S3J5U6_9EURO|nr:uncharacterized protein ATNIH1004_003894 [Aspergillus tanneri]KAA8648011.1 hypothetical protein ATNIH1004_003894 [Aspergillus tanneri]THC90072.1 hypothetical protein EYZ11_010468 [Aspergillus tanneri]